MTINNGKFTIQTSTYIPFEKNSLALSENFFHGENQVFHPLNNCHGVVRVRLIKARGLPCVADTPVQKKLSLPSLNGRI